MKKKFKKSFFGLLIALLIFPQTACDKCGTELCDLISTIVVQGVTTILVGEPFNVNNLVTNVASLATCGGEALATEVAGATATNFKVEQQLNGSYSTVENDNYDTPIIPSTGDNAVEGIFTATINEPGTYRIVTFADVQEDQNERAEDNNESNIAYGEAGKKSSEVIITVLPNPDSNSQKHIGKPIVEVVFSGYTPTKNYSYLTEDTH